METLETLDAADLLKNCKHEFKLYVMLCLPVVSYIFQVGYLQVLGATVVSVSHFKVGMIVTWRDVFLFLLISSFVY